MVRKHAPSCSDSEWFNLITESRKSGLSDTAYRELDSRIRYRLRMCIWKQWKTPQNREKNLVKLGIDRITARRVAYTGKSMHDEEIGKSIWEEERNYIDQICEQIEKFFRGISRRKNPSQIAVVNEVIKKSKRNRNAETDLISKGEKFVKEYISKNGNVTLKELTEASNRSSASVRRTISDLLEKGCIEKIGDGRWEGNTIYCIGIIRQGDEDNNSYSCYGFSAS